MPVRELYQYVLTKAGFKVTSVVDGAQGLKEAENNPDLILLDVMLPVIDGLVVLKKLINQKVIFLEK